jgi:hypothetical protein
MMSMSRDEASSAESRAENKYDTRATEASYLAAGQGQRRVELARFVGLIEQAAAGAVALPLIELRSARGPSWYLLAPEGGGRRVQSVGVDVVVVTPQSPVGRALAVAEVGDTVPLAVPSEVVSIA